MAKYKQTLNDMDRLWIDHNPEMPVADLSKKLRAKADTIREYQEEQANKPAPQHVTTTKAVVKKNHFAKKGGAIVMTEAQSYANNESKPGKPEHMKGCVHTFETPDND
tara:strand:+ start:2125 stop:2448 length:324 start_codon:yes stop_codon:yes gene_type:complete